MKCFILQIFTRNTHTLYMPSSNRIYAQYFSCAAYLTSNHLKSYLVGKSYYYNHAGNENYKQKETHSSESNPRYLIIIYIY